MVTTYSQKWPLRGGGRGKSEISAGAYCCGLRYGEVVSLTWQGINFENAEVRIDNRPATTTLPPFFVRGAEIDDLLSKTDAQMTSNANFDRNF